MTSFSIRTATIDDSLQIAELLSSLGHDTTCDQVRKNWGEFASSGNLAFVAVAVEGNLVGVLTLHRMLVLHRPKPVGRITALFVAETYRNLGIGRELMRVAEIELMKSDCGIIEITSNFRLPKAHAFYEHLGYTQTSVRLAKTLTDSTGIGLANSSVN